MQENGQETVQEYENSVCDINDQNRTPCEVWTRVMGYHRPVSSWNKGKQREHKDRVMYKIPGQ